MQEERKTAVYPGSFDPVTRGHLDVINRGVALFDSLVVAVLVNPEKSPVLPEEERVQLLAAELKGNPRVKVRSFSGLVTRLALDLGARWILRGLRSEADLAFELPMALSNRATSGDVVETVFLPARPELAFISSRLVRELARSGGKLDPFVTPGVARALEKHAREAARKRADV